MTKATDNIKRMEDADDKCFDKRIQEIKKVVRTNSMSAAANTRPDEVIERSLDITAALLESHYTRRIMRALLVTQNFFPELVGIGKYSHQMSITLTRRFSKVTTICAQKHFPSTSDRTLRYTWTKDIVWCPVLSFKHRSGLKRIAQNISFSLSLLLPLAVKARKVEYVQVVVPSIIASFVTAALVRLLNKRAIIHVHYQDMEVEAAFNLGLLRKRLLLDLALYIERYLLKNADLISAVSVSMKEKLITKASSNRKVFFMPNYFDRTIYPVPKANRMEVAKQLDVQGITPNDFVLMYSGSLNQKQGVKFLARVIEQTSTYSHVKWLIATDMSTLDISIKEVVEKYGLYARHFVDTDQLSNWLSLADLVVIPQRHKAGNIAMPSKMLSCMAAQRAFVTNAGIDSELYELGKRLGFAKSTEDPEQFGHFLVSLSQRRTDVSIQGGIGYSYATSHFSEEAVSETLFGRISSIADKGLLS